MSAAAPDTDELLTGEVPNHMNGISRTQTGATITGQRPWTSREIAELRRLAPLGARALADLLERSVGSVKRQAHRMRISLRPDGERRGTILGQPRGAAIATDRRLSKLRADVLAGLVDPARIERLGSARLLGRTDCPSCGIRPIEIESSGFCLECHLRALALGHELDQSARAANELDAARQRKHRRKTKGGDRDRGA